MTTPYCVYPHSYQCAPKTRKWKNKEMKNVNKCHSKKKELKSGFCLQILLSGWAVGRHLEQVLPCQTNSSAFPSYRFSTHLNVMMCDRQHESVASELPDGLCEWAIQLLTTSSSTDQQPKSSMSGFLLLDLKSSFICSPSVKWMLLLRRPNSRDPTCQP